MRYRLEKLNQVQYAYDEERRAKLEAEGFQVVRTEEDKGQGAGNMGNADSSGDPAETGLPVGNPEEKAGTVKKAKTPKAGNKKQAAEKMPEGAEAAGEPGPAEGEGNDAG